MEKEIKVTFYANVNAEDLPAVIRALNKCGADIIGAELPELSAIGGFKVEPIADVKACA